MNTSDDIAKGIYKGWLAIVGTRLFVSCLAFVIFGVFLLCMYLWFLNSLFNAPPLQFPIPTPAK